MSVEACTSLIFNILLTPLLSFTKKVENSIVDVCIANASIPSIRATKVLKPVDVNKLLNVPRLVEMLT